MREALFPTSSNTSQDVEPQKMARGLKFKKNRNCIIYRSMYIVNIIKSSDQLQNNWSTGQMIFTFVFALCKKPVFSSRGSVTTNPNLQGTTQTRLYSHIRWLMA